MLRLALLCFVVALLAAAFGWGGLYAGAVEIGKFLFFIFLVLFVLSLIMGVFRGRPVDTV